MFKRERPKEFIKGRNRTLRSALFWDITKSLLVIPYRCLGTSYPSHFQSSRNPRRNLFKDADEHRAYG